MKPDRLEGRKIRRNEQHFVALESEIIATSRG
jgi:hypothetical protein